MLRYIATVGFIKGLLLLVNVNYSRRWLQQQGARYIKNKLLSFRDASADEWRKQKLAEEAIIATDLLVNLLCDVKVPRAVKRGVLNIFRAFAGAKKRQEKYKCQVPAFFVLNPSDECDGGCPICYMDSRRKGTSLPLGVMKQIVNEMKKKLGIHFVVISGGEPFQKKKKLFGLARTHGDVAFMVYTNGTEITPKTVSMLAHLGNVVPAISLEGYEQETDERRGKGYFKNMTELMASLRKAGVLFGFSATVTRHNADVLSSDEFLRFCIEQGCRFGWYFIYVPIGRGADPKLMVTTEQRSHLSSQVFKWLGEGQPIIIGDFWNGGPLVNGCIAGKYYFVIEADGSIGPCVFMPVSLKDTVYDIFAGRSKYRSITEAIYTSPTFRECRENQARITDHTAPCQVIDHPAMARRVALQDDTIPNQKKTPPGFFNLHGDIQRALSENAEHWDHRSPREPHLVGSPYE